ncbi:uncharacterized, partial [Tachysurus ichikawai]
MDCKEEQRKENCEDQSEECYEEHCGVGGHRVWGENTGCGVSVGARTLGVGQNSGCGG